MHYLIAYLDKDGAGFGYGDLPYISDPCADGHQTEIALSQADFLRREGYRDVTVFSVEGDPPEEIEWEFVERNKIFEK